MNSSCKPRVATARCATGVTIAVLLPLLVFAAPRSEAVAVVGGPTSTMSDMARIVARAGGDILRKGAADNVIIARSNERGFVTRLYGAGAWLVLDPIVASLCGPDTASRPLPAIQESRANFPS